MAKPLFSIGPGGPLESGLAAARHKESVEFWHDGENVAFRNLGVETAIGAEPFAALGSVPIRIAQAWVGGTRRAYVQDEQFQVWGWDEPGPFFYIGTLAGPAQLLPWGSWLITAQNGLKLWKNQGGLNEISGALSGAALLARNSEHLLAASDTILAWADVRNVEDWEARKGNTARAIYFRNLEGPIKALTSLASGLGLYTADSLRLVSYSGAGFWFGERPQVLNGIGAIGPNSVISAGFKNYGITRNGIFTTDGVQFQYIDTPAFHGYLEEHMDWTRETEVFGFHNESYGEVVWFFPTAGGQWLGLGYKYTNGGFTKYNLGLRAAADRDVFDYPLFGKANALAYGKGMTTRASFVTTKPLDAGDSTRAKWWDHVRFVGEWGEGAQVKVGVHDGVNEEPDWVVDAGLYEEQTGEAGKALASTFYIYREATFLTIQLFTDEGGVEPWFEISQIMAAGEMAGRDF